MSDSDNVTSKADGTITILADLTDFDEDLNILGPAEVTGELTATSSGAAVQVYVRGNFVGTATPIANTNSTLFAYTFDTVGLDDLGEGVATSAGNWEITVEPLRDKVYAVTVEVEDLAANVSAMSQALSVEIDTLEPNTPLLDLVESSDTGRHDDDNITKDNTPDVSMTSEDPNAASHLLAANFKYRIYDRLEESAEVLVYDSFVDLGALTNLTQLTKTLVPLADGVHNARHPGRYRRQVVAGQRRRQQHRRPGRHAVTGEHARAGDRGRLRWRWPGRSRHLERGQRGQPV
jgi:hypothetical protein